MTFFGAVPVPPGVEMPEPDWADDDIPDEDVEPDEDVDEEYVQMHNDGNPTPSGTLTTSNTPYSIVTTEEENE